MRLKGIDKNEENLYTSEGMKRDIVNCINIKPNLFQSVKHETKSD